MHQSMWYFQTIRVHHMIAMKQNIEVNVSRPFVDGLDTAKILLDRLGSVEELLRLERRFNLSSQRRSSKVVWKVLTSQTPFKNGA